MSDSLAELFPDGDFRFHLTLRRVEPAEFFQPRDSSGRVLAERAQWIARDPARYVAAMPQAEAAIREFAALATPWVSTPVTGDVSREPADAILKQLGRSIEPDLLFLVANEDGHHRLVGGALCFPTGWALNEKLGHTMDFIHGVVPGLNAAIGPSIQQFLSRLKPGTAFLRDNWGIAATDELNLHPERNVPPPDLPVELNRLWLRVEHQALLALPDSRGIVFGIRIACHRMDEVAAGPHGKRLRRWLETMPREVVVYKRLERVLEHLLNVV